MLQGRRWSQGKFPTVKPTPPVQYRKRKRNIDRPGAGFGWRADGYCRCRSPPGSRAPTHRYGGWVGSWACRHRSWVGSGPAGRNVNRAYVKTPSIVAWMLVPPGESSGRDCCSELDHRSRRRSPRDEQRESKAALDDFAQEQVTLARGARSLARGAIDDDGAFFRCAASATERISRSGERHRTQRPRAGSRCASGPPARGHRQRVVSIVDLASAAHSPAAVVLCVGTRADELCKGIS